MGRTSLHENSRRSPDQRMPSEVGGQSPEIARKGSAGAADMQACLFQENEHGGDRTVLSPSMSRGGDRGESPDRSPSRRPRSVSSPEHGSSPVSPFSALRPLRQPGPSSPLFVRALSLQKGEGQHAAPDTEALPAFVASVRARRRAQPSFADLGDEDRGDGS